jgi:hypothetical protein
VAEAPFQEIPMAKRTRRSLDTALEQIIGHIPRENSRDQKGDEKKSTDVISRRDERGSSYPGDFPNPASDLTRGCF